MANESSDASSDDPWMIPPEEPAPHPGCPVLGRPVRMSALPPIADIRRLGCDVRFVPIADMRRNKQRRYSITSSA
jgi:hypothetical protein